MKSPSNSAELSTPASFVDGWNRFWFAVADPLPLSILRVGVGLIALAYFCSFGISPARWFSATGILPREIAHSLLGSEGTFPLTHPSLLFMFDNEFALTAVHLVALIAACALTLGCCTRVANIVTWVALLSYIHRAPMVTGHLEPVLAFLLLYLALGPAGAKLSLDQWWFNRQGPPPLPSVAANLSLRLIQVHLAMFYAMLAISKIHGDSWLEGEGIWMLLAQTVSRPVDLTSLRYSQYLLNAWSHAQVYVELAFPVLIWQRHTRLPVLVAAAVLWLLFIQVSGLLIFCFTMILALVVFVPLARLQYVVGEEPSP